MLQNPIIQALCPNSIWALTREKKKQQKTKNKRSETTLTSFLICREIKQILEDIYDEENNAS